MDLSAQVAEIDEKLGEYRASFQMLEDISRRKEAFETGHSEELNMQIADGDRVSVDELDGLSEDILNRRNETEENKKKEIQNRDRLMESLEEYEDNEAKYEQLTERLEAVKHSCDIFAKTRTYLTKAREAMTAEYVAPLQEGFNRYYTALTGEDASDFRLDANMELTKTVEGTQHDKDLFSLGYRDLYGFCMRLSMADAMYKGEKPVLILDDPFVNLDDGKTEKANGLIRKVSGDYQIIYLTCREDRV